jgi:putative spermidine/putrescine transport system ATP-binding protein
MSAVNIEKLVKRYGAATAVAGVSLHVQAGEFVALLGPSGCGKTTTLRMVAGFIEPTEGRIQIGGRDVTDLPPYKRNAGLVFQSYALFPHMSVAQNVGFGLEMRRVSKADRDARTREALARVRLAQYADRMPRELSGGQQQRVALARALVIEPEVLLLDEPLSNLDAKLRQEMRIEIRQLQQSLGLTAIFVTHDQEEALAVADRLIVMNAGRIEQIGTPSAVFEQPATRFVADFVGVTNFLPGAVTGAGEFTLRSGERVGIPPSATPGAALLALRPERLRVASGGEGLPGRVLFSTYLGVTTEYQVELASGDRLVVRQPAEAAGAGIGDTVRIHWPPSAALMLPAA